jgi:hypothetical protein
MFTLIWFKFLKLTDNYSILDVNIILFKERKHTIIDFTVLHSHYIQIISVEK